MDIDILILFKKVDLKVEKVKKFQRNYLESENFFTKFLYFFERENFQNLKNRK